MLTISFVHRLLLELMNEEYRISPLRRVYEAYVEHLEHARMFRGRARSGSR